MVARGNNWPSKCQFGQDHPPLECVVHALVESSFKHGDDDVVGTGSKFVEMRTTRAHPLVVGHRGPRQAGHVDGYTGIPEKLQNELSALMSYGFDHDELRSTSSD